MENLLIYLFPYKVKLYDYILKKFNYFQIMKNTPIYIKSIEIENIKTFGENSRINFEKSSGILPQWTIILGDNGIGKSTLLHCIVWMKPDLNDGNTNNKKKPKIDPIINHQENESLERLVRKSSKNGMIKATFIASQNLTEEIDLHQTSQCSTSISIDVDNERKLKDVKLGFKTNAPKIFHENEITIFCYSASRVLGKINIAEGNMEDTVDAFLEDNTILYDAEEILHTINYARLGASTEKEKERYESYFSKVKRLLVNILPDIENIKDIEVTSPRLLNSIMKPGEVLLSTKHGKNIAFKDFSLGYKTVISWAIDLSWRLFNKYTESNDPISEPAIVIVDEIDLHLHPVWQREIISNLTNIFPNIQFIASAHSPLMVQAALQQNYAVLKFEENAVKIINEPEDVDGWRIDQILTSPLFGLESARGEKYDDLLKERDHILQKKRQTKEDKNKLNQIYQELAELPVGETLDEIENRALITKLAEEIKSEKIQIKL
jgi:predicted ATP-binding protein involved in virulence